MGKQLKQFPLVADDEPVITLPRHMALYGNEDLIVNIHGDYQDKPFDWEASQTPVGRQLQPAPKLEESSDLDRLKQAARADVKKKRQALVVTEKKLSSKTDSTPKPSLVTKPSFSSSAMVQKPTAPLVAREDDRTWASYAKALEQTDYILVELPRAYQQPQNPSTKRPHKQNFDFLKQSQVYNYDDNQRKKERQIAQELNLSTFEDKY